MLLWFLARDNFAGQRFLSLIGAGRVAVPTGMIAHVSGWDCLLKSRSWLASSVAQRYKWSGFVQTHFQVVYFARG
jgi:hypothetical protein